jgi:hypothetical protein
MNVTHLGHLADYFEEQSHEKEREKNRRTFTERFYQNIGHGGSITGDPYRG